VGSRTDSFGAGEAEVVAFVDTPAGVDDIRDVFVQVCGS
jgi:hypothetical protein